MMRVEVEDVEGMKGLPWWRTLTFVIIVLHLLVQNNASDSHPRSRAAGGQHEGKHLRGETEAETTD